VSTVVSYARISKEEVGNKDNCEIQTTEGREYAADRGWSITRAFVDNNISISRRSTKPRESFEQMFAAIKAGQIDIVVVTEPERLYRRPRELEDLIDIAEAGQPIKIACTDGREFDLGTTSGKHDLTRPRQQRRPRGRQDRRQV
jgi:site-specific DNA recombinase